MATFKAEKNGIIFQRTTENRFYECVILARGGPESGHSMTLGEWKAVSWAGSRKLAEKKARELKKTYYDVTIEPAYEASAFEASQARFKEFKEA